MSPFQVHTPPAYGLVVVYDHEKGVKNQVFDRCLIDKKKYSCFKAILKLGV
jgi:hypothetical protein